MTNEYGTKLDSNGYAPSILMPHMVQTDSVQECCGCFNRRPCQRHEPFGAANRQKSKALGMWIYLCDSCHKLAHSDANYGRILKEYAQREAMKEYHWNEAEFIKRFGKNFLKEE